MHCGSGPCAVRGVAFGGILCDPPWPETGGTAPPGSTFGAGARGADQHYATYPVKEIPGIIMASPLWRPAPDCHLYCWSTNGLLPEALWVVKQLGFRYVNKLDWLKTGDRLGMGLYWRGQSESCLFAVRGDGLARRTAHRTLVNGILSPRRGHSQKPPEIYDKVEARTRGPWAELFGRGAARAGWSSWGFEAL